MDGADIRIPLAECREIYDVGDVDRAMESGSGARNEALTAFYGKMKTLGGVRYVVKPSSFDGLDPLYARCPNFTPVLDDLKRYLALAVAGNEPMNFTPILLLGEPGIGKTHFARQLANVLGTGFEFVSMSSLTAGWILSGASSQWSHAKPGKVAQALVCGDYANPLVVLDEVDKAGGDARYDPMGALYGLLEQDTARQFKDEFVEVDIDASHIMWVSTANDERSIPEPILSRMNVYRAAAGSRSGLHHRAHAVRGTGGGARLGLRAGGAGRRDRSPGRRAAARHAQGAAGRVRQRQARAPRPPAAGRPRSGTGDAAEEDRFLSGRP